MLVEDKGPVEYTDSDRASRMLEIVCNMYKCKYAILLNYFKENLQSKITLLLNIQSIIKDWLNLCGEECCFDDITDEEITARLLEVVIHYRRFFEDKLHCNKSWIFMYYSETIAISKLFNSSIISEFISDAEGLTKKINQSINIIRDITKFIPGLYVINDENNSFDNISVIPYYITHELTTKSDLDKGLTNTYPQNNFILIVSGNDLDFTALGKVDLNQTYKIYGYKRKHPTLFTSEDILNKLIFPHRKTRLNPLPMYISTYPILMLSQLKNLSEFKHIYDFGLTPLTADCKRMISKDIKSLCESNTLSYDDINNTIQLCETAIKMNDLMTLVYNALNIPNLMSTHYAELTSSKKFWKVDMIDYSIEELNDRYFLHYKVDFKALF